MESIKTYFFLFPNIQPKHIGIKCVVIIVITWISMTPWISLTSAA